MITFEAMNTTFLLAGLSPENNRKVQEMVYYAENTFSRFNPASEISHINQLRQQWVKISPVTFTLLKDAVCAYQETHGIFNPFLGERMEELGYDESFERLTPIVNAPCHNQLGPTTSPVANSENHLPTYLEFDQNTSMVRLAPTVALDLGGIAKGWITKHASTELQLLGVKQGLIDAGGDIVLWGQEPRQTLWGVGVANPFGADNDIASLWLEKLTSLATSSIRKRQWQTPDREMVHHILDPHTQEPANSDLCQVTVLSLDLVLAEEYAKCLLILGSKNGFPWIRKQRPELAYIAVTKDGTILTSNNLDNYCSEKEVLSHVHCCH